MRRVLFTYERNIPTVSLTYEMFHRPEFLNKDLVVTFKCIKDVTKADIANNDVLYMIRPNDMISKKLAKQARKSGLFVLFFCDDDLFHLPKDLPNIPYRRRCLKKCLVNSNIFVTNGEYLAKQRYEQTIDKRYYLANTIVQADEMVSHEDNEVIKFLYAGSVTHKSLFNMYLAPIFGKLVEKYGKQISFTFIGVHPDVEQYMDKTNIEFYGSMPLEKYREYVKKNNFDYGLAPLIANEFTKCKYFNKYLEYTLSGIVGVYSKVEPYIFVIKNGENGFLVDDNPDAWFECLDKLISDKKDRKRILDNAQQHVKNNFSAEEVFADIFKNVPEYLNHNRGDGKVYGLGLAKLNYRIHRMFDIIYLSFFYLFRKGPVGLIKQVKLHKKEMKAMEKLEENNL